MDENGVVNLTTDPTLYLDDDLKAEFLKADKEVFSIFRYVLVVESIRLIQAEPCCRPIYKRITGV